MKATVTSKGQITIPQLIRKRLKLETGSVLEFDEGAPCLLARRVVDARRMRSTLGCAKRALQGKSSAKWLEASRGPAHP